LWWVAKGRAVDPVGMGFRMGVSTSKNPAAQHRSRSERRTSLRRVSERRVTSLAHRSASRWRYRRSKSAMPAHLSPKLCRAVASLVQVATRTDSSPRLVRTTSPLTPTQSPRWSFVNPSKSPVTWASANSWTSPLESRIVAKARRPWARSSITRPATLTTSPDSSPSIRCAYVDCRSAA